MSPTVGADPEGLAALAVLLEQAAADLDADRLRLQAGGATPALVPALTSLAAVVDWLRRSAADVRRRAVVTAAAGEGWRHQSAWDHVLGFARAVADDLSGGVHDVMRGGGRMLAFDWYAGTDPVRAAELAWSTAETLAGNDPYVRGVQYLHDIATEGLAPATATYAHGTIRLLPGAALAALGGVRLVGASVVSNVSYLPSLAPVSSGGVTAGRTPALLRLAVPVGASGGERVALDPANGRFVVFRLEDAGVTARTTGWRELDRAERGALVDAGIVDAKGHLNDRNDDH